MSRSTWYICADALHCFKYWDDGDAAVFYSAASGDTHMLDAMAVELHQLLLSAPQTEEQLLRSLQDVFDAEGDTDPALFIRDHLMRLQEIGLLSERSA